MYKEGHAGISLLLFSPFIMLFNFLGVDISYVLLTGMLMVGMSSIPDLDIKWEIKHRGITHTLIFGIGVGILFGAVFGYAMGLLGFLLGFISGFGSTASHLLGDVLTHSRFKPFYPFSQREFACGICNSGNKTANQSLLFFGVVLFVLSLMI